MIAGLRSVFVCGFVMHMMKDIHGACLVSLKAWGFDDPDPFGYGKVDGTTIFTSGKTGANHYRGLHVIRLDPVNCLVLEHRRFDVWSGATKARELVDYVDNVSNGSVLIGCSGDDLYSYKEITDAPMEAMGVPFSSVGYRDKLTFIAVKGKPWMTLAKIKANATPPLYMNVVVTADKWHATKASRPSTPPLQITLARSKIECVIMCLKTASCDAVAVETTLSVNGRHVCELYPPTQSGDGPGWTYIRGALTFTEV